MPSLPSRSHQILPFLTVMLCDDDDDDDDDDIDDVRSAWLSILGLACHWLPMAKFLAGKMGRERSILMGLSFGRGGPVEVFFCGGGEVCVCVFFLGWERSFVGVRGQEGPSWERGVIHLQPETEGPTSLEIFKGNLDPSKSIKNNQSRSPKHPPHFHRSFLRGSCRGPAKVEPLLLIPSLAVGESFAQACHHQAVKWAGEGPFHHCRFRPTTGVVVRGCRRSVKREAPNLITTPPLGFARGGKC